MFDAIGRQLALCLGAALAASGASADDPYADERRRMVEVIADYARSADTALDRPFIDDRVLRVMESLPRHEFVPEEARADAYADRPVPIGYGQTISQPFIVALMTDLLRTRPDDTVLEIGTGSGYQAAVLGALVRRVHSIEIVPELGRAAARRLARLGHANVATRVGDGYYGWPEAAPFDAIVVTAAASHIPPPLVRQLKPGGRMIIPVGSHYSVQYLTVVEKRADGTVSTRQVLPVLFVPLTGSH